MGKLHSTDREWPPGSSSWASDILSKAPLGLVAMMLVGVAGQEAQSGPISINQVADLSFGRYAATQSQGGTVTINPANGGKTLTGPLFDFGAAHQRAKFHVTGDPDAAFSITLPSEITIDVGGDSMAVNPVTSSPSGSGVLDGTGSAEIYVGGTLTISANQAGGTYSNSFSVSVDYQ